MSTPKKCDCCQSCKSSKVCIAYSFFSSLSAGTDSSQHPRSVGREQCHHLPLVHTVLRTQEGNTKSLKLHLSIQDSFHCLLFSKKYLVAGVFSNQLCQVTGGFLRLSVLWPSYFQRHLQAKEARAARRHRNKKVKKTAFEFHVVLFYSVLLSKASWTCLPGISASSIYQVGQLKTRTQSCRRILDHVLLQNW